MSTAGHPHDPHDRTRHALRVVGEVEEWQGHSPEVLGTMLESLARLREEGLDVVED